jgi:hypothetical protein
MRWTLGATARRYFRRKETEEGVDSSFSEEEDQRATDVLKLRNMQTGVKSVHFFMD